MLLPLLYTLGSMICFTGASVVFGQISARTNPIWMNLAKVCIALAAFLVAGFFELYFSDGSLPTGAVTGIFLLSGAIGLGLGDIFMLYAFQNLGAPRTLIVYSFQPIIIGVLSFFFLKQSLNWIQWIAVLFLMLSVWLMAFERMKDSGQWQAKALMAALIGVLLDNIGIVITRRAFDFEGTGPLVANAIRCVGALFVIGLTARLIKIKPLEIFKQLSVSEKKLTIISCFFGTFVSLWFWLSAVKIANVALLSAMSGLSPVVAAAWDWKLNQKRPTRSFIFSGGLAIAAIAMSFYFSDLG
jgi:drug/metabolite transporter (DMT)-like permease